MPKHVVGLAVVITIAVVAVLLPRGGSAVGASSDGGAEYRVGPAADLADRDRIPLSPALQRATFVFDPAVAPSDRQVVLAAVARARPEAQRLIALVDGLVDVRVGATGETSAVGLTEAVDGRYAVDLDLGDVFRRYGQRGIDRTVLHELGHVVDHALVPDDLMRRIDATTPAGWGCDEGLTGACARVPERFAESFAKWAMNDIGVDLFIGYKVPPPDSLQTWGVPLAALAG